MALEPPDLPELPEVPREEAYEPPPPTMEEDEPTHCLFCGGALPTHRAVKFCPHCGQNQTTPTCPQCHSELEVGWKHCVNCGTPVGEG
jgi:hypothetical protein